MRAITIALSLGLVAGCADMQVKETEEAPRSVVVTVMSLQGLVPIRESLLDFDDQELMETLSLTR